MTARRIMSATAGWTLAAVAIAGGVGLLYLLRSSGWLASGPRVAAALPLQQLAGDAAQPLARVVAAHGFAGVSAGIALRLLTRAKPRQIAVMTALGCWTLLVFTGAASDAVANAGVVWPRLQPQLHHLALWVATASSLGGVVLGVGLVQPRPERRSRSSQHDPRRGATGANRIEGRV